MGESDNGEGANQNRCIHNISVSVSLVRKLHRNQIIELTKNIVHFVVYIMSLLLAQERQVVRCTVSDGTTFTRCWLGWRCLP